LDQAVYGDAPLKCERLQGPLLWVTVAAVGAFALVCLALAIWNALYGAPTTTGALFSAVLLVMAAGAATAGWFTLQRSVTIYGDRIEAANGFTTKALRRSEIKGYRRVRGDLVNLVPRDEFSQPLRISGELLRDPLTQKWFAGLPNLDAVAPQPVAADETRPVDGPDDATPVAPKDVAPADAAQSDDAQTVETDEAADDDVSKPNDDDLSADETPAPGQQAELSRLAWAANAAGIAIAGWTAFWPQPHTLAVLANIAAASAGIALKLYFGPLISIASDRNHTDPRPSISLLFMAPAFAMMYRAIWDFEILDWGPAIIFAAVMTLALGSFLIAHDRRLQSSLAIGVVLVLAVFFFGALTEINAMVDAAPPAVYRTLIAGLDVRHGKSTSYHMTLGQWGDQHGGEDLTVSEDFYSAHAVGQTVCVKLSRGWLGLRYYTFGDC
jgi:hypothetical protein